MSRCVDTLSIYLNFMGDMWIFNENLFKLAYFVYNKVSYQLFKVIGSALLQWAVEDLSAVSVSEDSDPLGAAVLEHSDLLEV